MVPYWPSAPLLVHRFWNSAVDYSFFEGRLALRNGRNANSLLGSACWEGLVLAVKILKFGALSEAFLTDLVERLVARIS